ncbi:MAG: hypothetical protein HC897_10615 [Thermoanaerobaculia bacterium]|nr:hypothetical protein [Thermoanaerobaculia bacterium]
MKRRRHLWLLLLLNAALLAPAALHAGTGETATTILSAEGKIWKLQSGSFGELFPGSPRISRDNQVLALDEIAQNGLGRRWLVPETDTAEGEFSPGLIYEETSGAVFVIWESLLPNAYSRLLLTSIQDEAWSEVIEITGNPFSRKGSPQLQVTREATSEAAPEAGRMPWTIVHLTWWEDAAAGKSKRYAPIVLQGGTYVGWTPVYDLGLLLPETPSLGNVVSRDLEEALTLQSGLDGRSVVVGFLDPHSGHLASIEVQALPTELSELAEAIRETILEIYAGDPTLSVAQLAEKARAQIIHIGSKFHASTITFLSEQIAQLILTEGQQLSESNVGTIADKARAQIIHIGAKLKAGGLENVEPWQLIEIGQTSLGGAPYQLLKVTPVGSWSPPDVGAKARLFLSESGHFALLAWAKDGRVRYRESLPDGGWSNTQQIVLGDTLDIDTAFEMLASRIKSR